MFHIFNKNEYLVDHLEGFVDIHNHILPKIDDGAKDVNESVELIKAFGEFGIRDFICTPHIMSNYYDNTPKTIKKSYKKLKKELEKLAISDITLNYAAEHMIDANFETVLGRGEILPLNGQFLLIEMSYLQPSINFDVAVEKILKNGFFPILAHPERYHYFKNHSFYKSEGLSYQLNLLSLGIYYGKGVQKRAFKLLAEGLIDFLGSDVHNTTQLKALMEIRINIKILQFLRPLLARTNHTFES
ncbi:MAG: CpsB/CapC family capsule biosynthesis tyrosine phosphatase [Bacteroidota bacterium]